MSAEGVSEFADIAVKISRLPEMTWRSSSVNEQQKRLGVAFTPGTNGHDLSHNSDRGDETQL